MNLIYAKVLNDCIKKENNNLKIKYYDVSNKERGFRKRMKEKFLVIIFFQ